MNKQKIWGLIFMSPLVLLLIGLLGTIAYLVAVETPEVYAFVLVILIFIYGRKLYCEA